MVSTKSPKEINVEACHVSTHSTSVDDVYQDCLKRGLDPKNCTFSVEAEYGEICIYVYGRRLETEKEVAARLASDVRQKEALKERERREFERLSAIYSPANSKGD